ncbi:hypothetical protein BV20DRAFT_967067 [Pilatotrama ljubarskyi]|nr:hypothetical protein BV20DRAFT_967067 [Pilatotrama ljubarskyi]
MELSLAPVSVSVRIRTDRSGSGPTVAQSLLLVVRLREGPSRPATAQVEKHSKKDGERADTAECPSDYDACRAGAGGVVVAAPSTPAAATAIAIAVVRAVEVAPSAPAIVIVVGIVRGWSWL